MNIQRWQVFVFALVPLAIVFAGVIGGSFHGADSAKESFAQAPPPPSGGTPAATTVPGATVLPITAQNVLFSVSTLRAPANGPVTIQLTNQDAGVLHNIGVFRTSAATQPLAPGSTGMTPFAGPGQQSLSFTTPAPGNYFFRCEVHPDTMKGTFIVQ